MRNQKKKKRRREEKTKEKKNEKKKNAGDNLRVCVAAGKCWTHLQMYCVIGEYWVKKWIVLSSPVFVFIGFITLIIIELL